MRRRRAGDRQPLLYSAEAFHVVTFVKAADGVDLPAALRRLRAASGPEARWIHVGKALVTAPSRQIGPVQWSAAVVAQYPSFEAYQAQAQSDAYREALGRLNASTATACGGLSAPTCCCRRCCC